MNYFHKNLIVIAATIGCTTIQAATLYITDDVGGIPAEWTHTAQFSKFDPALGTLTSIDLQVTSQLDVSETLKNAGSASQTCQFQMSEDVHFQDSTFLFSGDVLSASTLTPYTLAAGATTTVTTNVNGSNLSYTGITTPAVLAAYTGSSGIITFTISTLTGASIYGGGGVITATNDPVVSAVVEVIFHYAPPLPIPPTPGVAVYNKSPAVFFPTLGNGNFVLQMNTNLASTNWVTVTNYIPLTGFLVTNAPKNAFFRLH
jgi:hypothetical protein